MTVIKGPQVNNVRFPRPVNPWSCAYKRRNCALSAAARIV